MSKKHRTEEGGLVRKILAGERRAFEKFYRDNTLGLKRFISNKIGDVAEADELVQDTFLSFLDSLPLFLFRSSLKTFLYSIARHEVADYLRRKYAKRALKLVPIVGELVARELYTSRELSQRVDKAYQQLVPEQARILQLKYEEGLSVKEIAVKLKLSVKAAESKLFRARKAFQLSYMAKVGMYEAE